MSWAFASVCRFHDAPCDCEPCMKIDQWTLANDAGDMLGIVQAFEPDGPFYGNTAYGRTGPVPDRINCQAKVERMLETGSDRLGMTRH